MSETTDDQTPVITGPWQLAYHYANKHGGLVFGLIACLLIWVIMVQPELTRNAQQNEALREALQDIKSQTTAQQQLADHLKTTAEILDRIVTRLDSVK